MPVCRFWQTGNCKYGTNCRFEHPRTNDQSRQTHNLYRNQNRLDAFSRDSRQRGEYDSQHGSNTLPYRLDKERVRVDLTEDRPIWILSCYSPTPETPRQLFSGVSREQSCEELRLRHYELTALGREQQAIQEAQTLYQTAEQQIQATVRDLDGAIQYIIRGKDDRPNRIDICKECTRIGSYMQDAADSAPRKPASRSQGSSFGQPSQFVQPSAFGQPSIFGRPSNPFARNTSTQGSSMQATPLAVDEELAFGQQRNPFAQAADAPPSILRNSSATSPASTQQGTSAAMETPSTGVSGLRQVSSPGQTISHITNQVAPNTLITAQPFVVKAALHAGPQTSHLPTIPRLGGSRDSQKNAQGLLISWEGKQISYIDGEPCFKRADNNWERVWFPELPRLDEAEELPASMYSPGLEEGYRYIREHRTFRNGLMPELAPKKAWCNWDF